MSETSPFTVAEKWQALHAVLPVFYSASLEPIDGGVNHGDSGAMDDVDSVHLQHAITALRTDLKLNMLRQSHIGTQWLLRRDIDLESLAGGLQILFEAMESLFNEDFCPWPRHELHIASADANPNLKRYPRLMLLWETLQMHEIGRRGTHDQPYDWDQWILPKLGNSSPKVKEAFMRIKPSWRQRYSLDSVGELSRHICFPRDYEELKMLRKIFSHFRLEMENITGQRIPRYRPEVRINPFTTLDAQTIQQAHGIAAACTWLFTQIAASSAYGNHHRAKLHLPGFKKDQLKLDISICQGTDMVPAVFTRSLDRPPNETFDPRDIFLLDSSNPERSGILHFAFNQDFIWIQHTGGEVQSLSSSGGEEALDLHLGNLDTFPPMHRKMTSVLFAASMFQLSDTPWVDPRLDLARAFVPMPIIHANLQQWYPRIYCNLELGQTTSPQSDNIAALGVLLMQLEAARKSEWLPDADKDWITGQRSNHFRLFRMLGDMELKGRVSDGYRQIARACLEFDGLVDDLEHPEIGVQRKALTIIYKCILGPLHEQATSHFGDLKDHFNGIFGYEPFSVPTAGSHLATAKSLTLFDDEDSRPSEEKKALHPKKGTVAFAKQIYSNRKMSRKFRQNLEPFFSPPKIRIAVLDSGVDANDFAIHYGIEQRQINYEKSKTFVHPNEKGSDNWRKDTCGHGTHVTELLLETAPAAEIFVGKISTDKVINQEYMPGIAEAINWAANECGADIISLSFGYEDHDDLIERALKNAISKGKLIIAAASNNGGLKGRSRPARREGVLCIHATDGKGNKGDMNPSPQKRSDNFATLGVNVSFHNDQGEMWKSGTSFATPIAVGFAAAVLEFARYREVTGRPISRSRLLGEKRGMEAVFRMMSEERDGYDFIHPFRIWGDKHCKHENDCTCWREKPDEAKVARVFEDALEDL
ncbi:hypothetical protein FMUND_12223 [Fusarium mundagurra]|uniref:Peptidase S8/S53 domain-containing protein n=1 Tax=Fusarium mundagurra TaxID=1567541 RepID=A0A8H5Y3U3_9HYPO|nr:hypothetical protein FMUND_12223 [Fusarium mundagurra]